MCSARRCHLWQHKAPVASADFPASVLGSVARTVADPIGDAGPALRQSTVLASRDHVPHWAGHDTGTARLQDPDSAIIVRGAISATALTALARFCRTRLGDGPFILRRASPLGHLLASRGCRPVVMKLEGSCFCGACYQHASARNQKACVAGYSRATIGSARAISAQRRRAPPTHGSVLLPGSAGAAERTTHAQGAWRAPHLGRISECGIRTGCAISSRPRYTAVVLSMRLPRIGWSVQPHLGCLLVGFRCCRCHLATQLFVENSTARLPCQKQRTWFFGTTRTIHGIHAKGLDVESQ